MPIVATAGHVDHGKSTLVEALTGSDPDRWAEEKERGLTIDLGFAWTQLGDHDVGFVDVPGHERFIKNMLAGVGAVDCALLVVAADEGWMPQTEEHAAVLDLLEVERGVVAITRIDLVDADTAELAELEVIEEIEGTHLEGWPIVGVSSVTGDGLDALRTEVITALDAASAPSTTRSRMWVDRSFVIAGAGTIATGTVLEGSFSPGDDADLFPGPRTVRVRGVQHHGGPAEAVAAGDRAAISFTGSVEDLERGDLLATPGAVTQTQRLLVGLSPTRAFEEIPVRGAFHLHIGTASVPVAIRRVGDEGGYLVVADEPVPAAMGDRIVLRDSGRKAVVGGGRILDPHPADRPSAEAVGILTAALSGDADDHATALLEVHGSIDARALAAATDNGSPRNGALVADAWISDSVARDVLDRLHEAVTAHQSEFPSRPGMPKSELASRLGHAVEVVDALVATSSDLTETEGAIHTTSFSNELAPDDEEAWASVRKEMESSFDVPRLSALPLEDEVVHFLLRRGDLVRIERDLAFTDRQASEINERVAELHDGFTVSEFKDHFGMARRQAVPTLEWLDSIGRTRRAGDGRSVR